MSEQEKFLIIKKHIDRMDYYGLLAGGAPWDEFDAESKEICNKISFHHSAQEIAEIIASVFNYAFEGNDASEKFLPIAESIKNEFTI